MLNQLKLRGAESFDTMRSRMFSFFLTTVPVTCIEQATVNTIDLNESFNVGLYYQIAFRIMKIRFEC